ncbi:MAG TPA: N-acetylmuramoyl-L-alanine amidase [bacterium]|nr:N-acetylmuramoyl-L-alanine amidase [bacterium]
MCRSAAGRQAGIPLVSAYRWKHQAGFDAASIDAADAAFEVDRTVQISSSARRTLALVALVSLGLVALGAHAPGATAQSTHLRVIANGSVVPLAGTVVIQNGTIMAPYPGLFEPLGIRASWNPRERTLSLLSPAGDEMLLRAGDPYVAVNGERRPVPIPLVAVFDRVLIPVQWVFETLGDVTAYDPGDHTLVISPQITGITWRGTNAGLEVSIDATGPLHPTTGPHDPEHLVLDFPGAVAKSTEQTLDVHEGTLTSIRIARVLSSGTRVAFTFAAPTEYRLVTQVPGRRVVVALGAKAAPPPSSTSYQPSAQKISDVIYQHVDGGGRIVVVGTHPVQAAQRILHNPERVVIDIPDAVFLPVKKFLDVDDGLVAQVRAAQFHRNPNIVRIVIELARPSPFAVRPGAETGQFLVELGAAIGGGVGRPVATGPRGPVVVAVDAGHGGSDPGAIGPAGVKEKDVVLAIALALRALLAQQHFDVVMIRDADVFVPLEDRAQIAFRGGATLFVSVHANASTDVNATGIQTFYSNPASQPFAQVVLDEAGRAAGLAARGTTQALFKVLVDTDRIPSILVETAFITNAREEQMLRDPQIQQAMAQGILKGIQRYVATPQAAAP